MTNNSSIAVIGGGITGLTAAHKFQKMGLHYEVFEKNSLPGGAIKTVKSGLWQVEYGPNTMLLKDKIVKKFLEETGAIGEKVTANKNAEKRYILKNGRLEALPGSATEALKTSLFSLKGKLRVLAEPFISKSNNPDQTVAEFAERRLGEEILDYAINPFVAGIFANSPDALSLRHAFPIMHNLEQEYGSLIWGSLAGAKKRKESGRITRELISFSGGIGQLPTAIASTLDNIHLNTEILSIEKKLDGWHLFSNKKQYGPFNSVVLNTPLYKWNTDFLSIEKEQMEKIQSVYYPPLSVFCLGFRKDQVSHPLDGFGFLVPEKEKRSILGALFSSTLFDKRAPAGHHLLTVFVGGGRQPKLATLETEKLLPIVLDELTDIIGLDGEPVFRDHIFWPKSIPAYHVGYDEILQVFNAIEDQNPGLYLAGNYRHGISVPDCILNGLKLADRVAEG
ncbi:MAG: protoporphyrinogen oxidase [Balneolaceae bacterium]|nr:MAG: protoporphyrinogen oxidase [Balneolaceae bacterium]